MPSSNTEFGQIRVHVLYKRAEIPAKTVIPAIALLVTYRKQENLELKRITPDRLVCVDQEVKEPAQARNEFPNLGEAILIGQNLVRLLSE